MAGVLQHLRSSTLDKRPNPASMVDGQVAINYASGAPGMFFKNSNGDLVKVGPVHVGSGAPNASPASGGTAGNSIGEQWLDTSGGTYVFKIWDGSAWRSEAGEFVNTTGDTMTGALGIITGSSSTPGVFFSGDTNTGIYSPGADQVAVATSGTGRLFVDASGNVGINRAPTRELTVHSPNNNNAIIQFTNTDTGITAADGILFGLDGNENCFLNQQEASKDIIVYTAGTGEKLRITSAGLVGIGTSTPAALLEVRSATTNAARLRVTGTGTTAGNFRGFEFGNGSVFKGGLLQDESTNLISIFTPVGGQSVNITSAGSVGIGTTSPGTLVDVIGGNSIRLRAASASVSLPTGLALTTGFNAGYLSCNDNSGIAADFGGFSSNFTWSANTHRFSNLASTTEYARIDSSGRLLVGTTTARSQQGVTTKLQVENTDYDGLSLVVNGGTTANRGPVILMGRSRGTTLNSSTVVASGDRLGLISFQGADGADIETAAASITAEVDGTPGANDMPGRLVFSTTADGASSPTERMRITSDAYVRLASGTGGIQFNGDTAAANALDDYEEGTWTPAYAPNTGSFTSISYTANTYGFYTKVGKIVTILGQIETSALDTTGAGAAINITGLPFTAPNVAAVALGEVANWSGDYPLGAETNGGSTSLRLLYRTAVNGATLRVAPTDMSTANPGNTVKFSCTYLAA